MTAREDREAWSHVNAVLHSENAPLSQQLTPWGFLVGMALLAALIVGLTVLGWAI